jgi:hypothetical protein
MVAVLVAAAASVVLVLLGVDAGKSTTTEREAGDIYRGKRGNIRAALGSSLRLRSLPSRSSSLVSFFSSRGGSFSGCHPGRGGVEGPNDSWSGVCACETQGACDVPMTRDLFSLIGAGLQNRRNSRNSSKCDESV